LLFLLVAYPAAVFNSLGVCGLLAKSGFIDVLWTAQILGFGCKTVFSAKPSQIRVLFTNNFPTVSETTFLYIDL
jgi:hypothetical protein